MRNELPSKMLTLVARHQPTKLTVDLTIKDNSIVKKADCI